MKNFKKRTLGFGIEQKKNIQFENNPEINNVLDKIGSNFTYDQDFVDKIFEDDYFPANEFLNSSIKIDEIQPAIEKFKCKSSPGRDLISYAIIKQLPKSIYPCLCNIFNCLIDNGLTPPEWSQYNVGLTPCCTVVHTYVPPFFSYFRSHFSTLMFKKNFFFF